MADSGKRVFELDALVDDGPWSGRQKLVLVAMVLVFLFAGFGGQVVPSAIPAMAADWKAPAHIFALPLALGWAGAAVGTVLGGILADRLGRKPTVLAALVLSGVTTLLVVQTRDITILAILRFLAGVGMGAGEPAAFAMIAEYTPKRRRGRAIATALLVALVGIGGSGVIASLVLPVYGWQSLFLIGGGGALLLALWILFGFSESPRLLAKRPQSRGELLRELRRMGRELPADAEIKVSEPPAAGPIKSLFTGGLAVPTFCLWGGFLFTYMGLGLLFSWAPTLLTHLGSGMAWAGWATAAQSVGGMLGSSLGGMMTERFGGAGAARILTGGSAVGAVALAVAVAVAPTEPLLLLSLLSVEGALVSGALAALYAAAAELYPSNSRSTGIGTAGAVARIGAILSSYVGVMAIELAGGGGYFAATLLASLLALAALFRLR